MIRLLPPVFLFALTIIATLILGTLTEVKDQSKRIVTEFQEYQKLMEKRVSRIEWKIWGDKENNQGYMMTDGQNKM